ncbi:linker for activation of T-cells family member 2 isoform 2-T5 [Dama dama]|uniref:linker for activation of T-cells family member 2 isoform X2 n=1 Tax=Dama dama TaxID=30532 RepID=UPI002A3671C2|nr:linker for activation of T-cells family member 2 isoform X2 [Dama dama]
MSADTELLWPGAALLLLLGAAAGLCVRCSRPGAKKSEKIYEQRSLQENQQSFAVARTYTLVREAWPGDTASNMELTRPQSPSSDSEGPTKEGCGLQTPRNPGGLLPAPSQPRPPLPCRKDKMLRFSPSLEDSSSPRDPTSTDYYNYDPFQKPAEDDDDTNSYENVLICKPKRMESGDEGSEDYQNSASIQQWRESKRVVESALREAPLSLAGSPDEDGEPDYVNGDVAATEA